MRTHNDAELGITKADILRRGLDSAVDRNIWKVESKWCQRCKSGTTPMEIRRYLRSEATAGKACVSDAFANTVLTYYFARLLSLGVKRQKGAVFMRRDEAKRKEMEVIASHLSSSRGVLTPSRWESLWRLIRTYVFREWFLTTYLVEG